jgi:hypothetical protein
MLRMQNPMAVIEADDDDIDPRGVAVGLAIMCVLGLLLGVLGGMGAWEFYPPSRGHYWEGPTAIVASALVLVVSYLVIRRRAGRQAGDWLVLGYAIAMLLLTGLVLTSEAVELLHAHVGPATFGVPRGDAGGQTLRG